MRHGSHAANVPWHSVPDPLDWIRPRTGTRLHQCEFSCKLQRQRVHPGFATVRAQ